jgi:hypothetical protein
MSLFRFAVVEVLLVTTGVILILFVRARWAAARLAFQPTLGEPASNFTGLKHTLWKLFAWWLAFDAQGPIRS